MIVENGYVRTQVTTGGGLNKDGDPIPLVTVWSDPIPCNIRTNQHANNGTVNGNTFSMASYEVLIEKQPFAATCVRLERDGVDLGEYQVQAAIPFDAVDAIKITV